MDKLTAFLGFMVALSLATERVTETIKGLPGLSGWFAATTFTGHKEELRKATIHIVAIGTGTLLSYLTHDQLASALSLSESSSATTKFWGIYVLFGAMASGGSGMWNSLLDIVRGINQQKQIMTDNMKSNVAQGKNPNS